FVPTNQVIKSFSGTVPAGTGLTVAWSYTVPEGKRACVEVVQSECDTDADPDTYADIYISDGTNTVYLARSGQSGGISRGTHSISNPRITLLSGQTIEAVYRNASASDHFMLLKALITELE
ncbi:MAG: hypothetical protein DRN49_05735, partial [Thaumarchaeota archaeon]